MVGHPMYLPSEHVPSWLQKLLATPFFGSCPYHAAAARCERNMFCVDCESDGLCQMCAVKHADHRIIQIRRSSYHDVVRVNDMSKLADVSGIQTYIINSARILFINQRPQPRPSKGFTYACEVCSRSLQENMRYCSIACKMYQVMALGPDKAGNLIPKGGATGNACGGNNNNGSMYNSHNVLASNYTAPKSQERPLKPEGGHFQVHGGHPHTHAQQLLHRVLKHKGSSLKHRPHEVAVAAAVQKYLAEHGHESDLDDITSMAHEAVREISPVRGVYAVDGHSLGHGYHGHHHSSNGEGEHEDPFSYRKQHVRKGIPHRSPL
eukprot:jgi/Mesvir1/28234/Mv04781-RA.1